jgi:phosphoglycerate kinase
MKSLKQIKNIKGKTALVRVDFNVPIRNGKILDNFRIQKAMPTIKFLQKKGAKIILISHLDKESGTTLKPVADYLQKYFKVDFCTNLSDIFSSCALPEVSGGTLGDKKSQKSSVYLFENLRLNKGE